MTALPPAPVTIEGRFVRLEPLSLHHVPDLYLNGGGDEEVWSRLPVAAPRSEYEMRGIVEQRLAQQAAGGAVLFSLLPVGSYRPAGWIGYVDISVSDEYLGIGWFWTARPLWNTPVPLEAHLLLVHRAFHALRFGRVQWQIDHADVSAQDVVLTLGAAREGVLRRHVRRPDGTWRDTVLFSLLASEWERARERAMSAMLLE